MNASFSKWPKSSRPSSSNSSRAENNNQKPQRKNHEHRHKHTSARESPAKSWGEVPGLIDARRTEANHTVHGISRSICGNEVGIDFGDEQGEISIAKITFRNHTAAWAAYCKGIRLEIKVVEHPELEEKPKETKHEPQKNQG